MNCLVWIQDVGYEIIVEEHAPTSAHVLELLEKHDWTEQLTFWAEDKAKGCDVCPPGLCIENEDSGDLLHLFPNCDRTFDVHWCSTVPSKMFGIIPDHKALTKVTTGMSRESVHEAIRRFMHNDQAWLDAQFGKDTSPCSSAQ